LSESTTCTLIPIEFAMLTVAQRKFAEEYINNGNAKQSAIVAGFSEKSANNAGFRLKNDQKVKQYMQYLASQTANQAILDSKNLQMLLSDIAKGTVNDSLISFKGDIIDVRVHSRERIRAIEQLAKIQGLYSDGSQINNMMAVQFADDIPRTKVVKEQ
jgi:phage terminase small subunit